MSNSKNVKNINNKLKSPLHPVQMKILQKIMLLPKARFRDLRLKDMPTDHFTYHLHNLIKLNLIYKDGPFYVLTDLGKSFVGTLDEKEPELEKIAKRGILARFVKFRNGQYKYLVYKRLKQPFFGHWGFHTGKIRFGEKPVETLFREYKEETGLIPIDYEFIGIYHQLTYNKDGQLLRDIYLYTFNIYKAKGKLLIKNDKEGVENHWLTKKELKTKPTYPDFWSGDYPIHWLNLPKYFKRYQRLKTKNKWINTPVFNKDGNSTTKIYFIDRVKSVNSW